MCHSNGACPDIDSGLVSSGKIIQFGVNTFLMLKAEPI